MATTVRSFAKINLGLAIGPVRADGFHALTTLYQTLEAHDLVTVEAARAAHSSLALSSDDPRVPLDERNTVHKALSRAVGRVGGAWQVRAHITKRLPIQGGLGAGSANAAAALLAFERELGQPLPAGEALRIAAEVGSDVPLFLLGGAVLGTGRGEQVVPLPDLAGPRQEVEVVLALPEVGVSTPAAFAAWDQATTLTAEQSAARLEQLSRVFAHAVCEPFRSSGVSPAHAPDDLARQPLPALVRTGIQNDFEDVVFRLHPPFRTIKDILLGAHPLHAALSGSGSALFALFPDPDGAARAERELAEAGVKSLRTRCIGRAQYWRAMWL